MLDKLKKLTTKGYKLYLNQMFEEDHLWARDQILVPTIFPQKQIYIQAWNILNVSIQSSIIHLNMYEETIPMDTNINNFTWVLDEKWIFLLM